MSGRGRSLHPASSGINVTGMAEPDPAVLSRSFRQELHSVAVGADGDLLAMQPSNQHKSQVPWQSSRPQADLIHHIRCWHKSGPLEK